MAQPGLQLALDKGAGCEGLAFRIDAALLDGETFVLWRREMIAPAYRPVMLALDTAPGPIEALGFVADHGTEQIVTGIPMEEKARMIATASGFLGSNFDYLAGTRAQLAGLGVSDPYVEDLYARVMALRS